MDSPLRRGLPLAALAAAAVLASAAAPAQAGLSPSQALTVANAWRAAAHEPGIATMDPSLNDGCAKHNNYMAQNGGQLTHFEDPSKPGYTSEGSDAGQRSVLAIPEGDPHIWEQGVYHRLAVLQPRLRTSGFDTSHGFSCMQIRGIDDSPGTRTSTLSLYPWPADGTKGVPLTFSGGESPNPYDETPGVEKLGFLLSVEVNGPWSNYLAPQTKVDSASLTTDGGTPVALTAVDDSSSKSGPYIDSGFALFPHGRLLPATVYSAHAHGSVSAEGAVYPFDVAWHFKTLGSTVPAPKAKRLNLAKGKPRGKKVRFKLTAQPVLVGRAADVAVTKKKGKTSHDSIVLKAKQTVTVARPGRGKSVRVKVSVASFDREGLTYGKSSASRRFKRKR
jgi:hypothetical protein